MVKIYPAKDIITSDNRQYFTILDAVRMLKEPCIDADNPVDLIKEYIKKNKLELNKIREFANRFYDKNTLDNLALCGG